MIFAGERTLADFRQHPEMNGVLFVRGRVRDGIRVAASVALPKKVTHEFAF